MCALWRSTFVLYIVLGLARLSLALPMTSRDDLQYVERRGAVVKDLGGEIIVLNSATGQLISQGTATDGGGTDYDAAALVWLIGTLVIGVPLAIAGVRGWRLTLGSAIGLAIGVCGKSARFQSVYLDFEH